MLPNQTIYNVWRPKKIMLNFHQEKLMVTPEYNVIALYM